MSINASVTDLKGNKSNLFLRYDALEPATRNLICYLFPSSSNLDLILLLQKKNLQDSHLPTTSDQ